jgi:23S rRNA (guanosine2251-2'-O)-methyltransferase
MRNIIGFHAIEESIRKKHAGSTLYLHRKSHKRNAQLETLAQQNGVKVIHADLPELDRLAGGGSHRGAVLVVSGGASTLKSSQLSDFIAEAGASRNSLVIALDGVTDPQNLGAVMRSADLFAADFLILPERRSSPVNQTLLKVSSGAAEYVPYAIVPNLVRSLQNLQKAGFWVYGADMNGETVSSVSLTGKIVLVLGSEESGLSKLVQQTCDRIISIPTKGHIDSLNIAAAAAVLMYEVNRQRASAG